MEGLQEKVVGTINPLHLPAREEESGEDVASRFALDSKLCRFGDARTWTSELCVQSYCPETEATTTIVRMK
jgi:hypothetical protein